MADEFEPKFDSLPKDVQTEILAPSLVLERFGPQLGRPRMDTLNGSRHPNMKELRFSAVDGEWLSLLTPSASQSCSQPQTSPAEAGNASTKVSCVRPIGVLEVTFPG